MKMGRLSAGLIIILMGAIFLAINLGYLPWNIWFHLLRLWPVLLIAIGIDLIFKRSSFPQLRILAPLLIIATVGVVIYLSSRSLPWKERELALHLEQPLSPHITEARVEINFGAGDLIITGGSNELLSGEFISLPAFQPILKYRTDDGRGILRIEEKRSERYFNFKRWGGFHSWNLKFNSSVDLVLDINTGASRNDFDFSSLRLKALYLDCGASHTKIKFGKLKSEATIKAGASQIQLFIPRSLGLSIETDIALTSGNLDELDFKKEGKTYLSPNYLTAEKNLKIKISAGISRLEVSLY